MDKSYLRRATEEDIDLLFQWVNEVAVRGNSFATSPVSYEEKYDYFELDIYSAKQYDKKRTNILGGGGVFLTNNKNTLGLYEWLAERYPMTLYSEPLQIGQIMEWKPDIIISYNYKHIIGEDIIAYMQGKIVNLHISLLPWNRGSNPNFWSFLENTPKGVTIHQINAGIDTGKILYQKECFFDAGKETFLSTYESLNCEIADLFKEKWEEIMTGQFVLKEQEGEGSSHTMKDFKKIKSQIDFEWSDSIAEVLERYERFNKNLKK